MQDGIEDIEIMFVGCLSVELEPDEQDVSARCFAFLCTACTAALANEETLKVHVTGHPHLQF